MTIKAKSALLVFYEVASAALIRAEAKGKVAERFCGDGLKRWEQFANELNMADLLDLAIRDASVPYPVPFGLRDLIDGYTDRDVGIGAEATTQLIESCQDAGDRSDEEYIQAQAVALGIDLVMDVAADNLPLPLDHHSILECPGSGGWLSYLVQINSEAQLYFWENFRIACSNWREAMLAGLIAFELDAPPNYDLPIVIDESMKHVLEDSTYDWIIGARKVNANRQLSGFVSQENGVVLI